MDACPVNAITEGEVYQIDRTLCLECGSCHELCPVNATEPAEGL